MTKQEKEILDLLVEGSKETYEEMKAAYPKVDDVVITDELKKEVIKAIDGMVGGKKDV